MDEVSPHAAGAPRAGNESMADSVERYGGQVTPNFCSYHR